MLHALEGAPGRVETAPKLARVLDAGGPEERLARCQGEFEVADLRGREARELVLGLERPGGPARGEASDCSRGGSVPEKGSCSDGGCRASRDRRLPLP
jgi:hypothetical protein